MPPWQAQKAKIQLKLSIQRLELVQKKKEAIAKQVRPGQAAPALRLAAQLQALTSPPPSLPLVRSDPERHRRPARQGQARDGQGPDRGYHL